MPYRKLGEVALKNGKETLLALVRSPAGEWHGPLCGFLNSAPQPEGPPLHAFLLGNEMPGLDARYFIALQEGEIIGCVWKGLATPDGRLFGDAVLRPHDAWAERRRIRPRPRSGPPEPKDPERTSHWRRDQDRPCGQDLSRSPRLMRTDAILPRR